MTMTIEKVMPDVIELLTLRPGLRTVQIADSLDVDFDLVEEALKRLAIDLEGGVYSAEVEAPNGRKALAWWPVGITSDSTRESASTKKRQATPQEEDDKELLPAKQVTRPAAGTVIPQGAFPTVPPSEETTAAPVISGGRPSDKTVRAIAYLRHHPAATNEQMKRLLGISYSPTAALKTAVEKCWLTYKGQTWTLGPIDIELTAAELMAAGSDGIGIGIDIDIDATHAASTVAKKASAADVAAYIALPQSSMLDEIQANIRATDTRGLLIIEILRMKLTPEEYKGFLKGSIVLHTLRAERVGTPEDYQQAAIYSGHLVDATADKTA